MSICPACDRGERTITPPHSSIVGSAPVHMPSGQICLKWVNEKMTPKEMPAPPVHNYPLLAVLKQFGEQSSLVGKTLEQIAFIASAAGHAPCRSGGIDEDGVCPNTCFCEWAKEIRDILAPLGITPKERQSTDADSV